MYNKAGRVFLYAVPEAVYSVVDEVQRREERSSKGSWRLRQCLRQLAAGRAGKAGLGWMAVVGMLCCLVGAKFQLQTRGYNDGPSTDIREEPAWQGHSIESLFSPLFPRAQACGVLSKSGRLGKP